MPLTWPEYLALSDREGETKDRRKDRLGKEGGRLKSRRRRRRRARSLIDERVGEKFNWIWDSGT